MATSYLTEKSKQVMASDHSNHGLLANNTNLVDDFEEAFQGIISGFTKEDGLSHTQDNKEELRTDAEQNVAKFIEVAKQLETFFLQRRLQISVLKPEQLIKEDCSELKQELARKDELIKKHYEKISIWLNMLGEPHPPAPVANGVPIVGDGSSAPQQQPSQNIPFQHR
ncbi:mediator of RNA polymerase II transcription subunit 28-like [Daphnia pulicaria]|uniref:mediator of RNA polymerase II transcription subunit 28-like n=1 Tax=Daphnia pulicaria TaxID=35523 RepID=UPI001EECE783|nr:mediator of RNA polymerase II transcription subunit 28-like [Daphnia pulicaria]